MQNTRQPVERFPKAERIPIWKKRMRDRKETRSHIGKSTWSCLAEDHQNAQRSYSRCPPSSEIEDESKLDHSSSVTTYYFLSHFLDKHKYRRPRHNGTHYSFLRRESLARVTHHTLCFRDLCEPYPRTQARV